ncbi:sigma factor [Nonomuraea sp. NPDC050790]|uniref:sigma factor n=1 Tax=Nonomuraea sp. NPDC050790 TaxID=3364371 RepID=UPI0037933BCD
MAADEELRARLLCGELGALEDAYDEHAPSVYGLALRVTGSPAIAEEITEEVFTALWERPGAYDPRHGTLRAWLVTRGLHESALRSKVG